MRTQLCTKPLFCHVTLHRVPDNYSDYVKLLGQVLCLFLLLPTALTFWFIRSELNADLKLSTWELLQVCVSQSSTSAMGQFCWRKAQAVSPALEANWERAPFCTECWIPASWTSTDTNVGLRQAHLIPETNSSINERKWRNKRVTSQNCHVQHFSLGACHVRHKTTSYVLRPHSTQVKKWGVCPVPMLTLPSLPRSPWA